MSLHQKVRLLALLVVALVISTSTQPLVGCKPTSAGNSTNPGVSSNSQQQQQQQRQVGSGKQNQSNVDQVAALLAAKPRSTQTSATTADQSQKPAGQKLQAEASTSSSTSTSTSSSPASKPDANTPSKHTQGKKLQGKRQADFGTNSAEPTTSRRNEDPWFLDQAPLPLQPYRFMYNVKDKNGLTEQYRQEAGDGKFLTGSYGYVLPDGIYRHVDYVADDHGFRAFIRTSEPGTANQNPADVVINSNPVPGVSYADQYQPSLGSFSANRNRNPGSTSSSSSSSSLNSNNFGNYNSAPTAAWNYTNLLPPIARQSSSAYSQAPGPLLDYLRSIPADGNSILPRRPPGAIVGAPITRNFTSFAYQPSGGVPSALDLNPLAPASSGQFRPSENFDTAGVLKPTGQTPANQKQGQGANNLTSYFGSGHLAQGQFYSDYLGHLAPLTQQLRSPEDRTATLTSTSTKSHGSESEPLFRPPSTSYSGVPQPSRPGLYLPARSGPDVLLYDQPFVVQTRPDNGPQAHKLHYDHEHILAPGSHFLSLERANNLAHLEQLNAAARGFALRPLNVVPTTRTAHEPGSLAPLPLLSGGLGLGQLAGGSSSSSEHHQQEHHSTSRQLVDDANRVTLTKEHKSGSASGSGREFGFTSSRPQDLAQLPAPPQPHFQQAAQLKPVGVKGGGGHSARLFAPYAAAETAAPSSGRKSSDGVKGGPLSGPHNLQQQKLQDSEQDLRRPSSPVPPEEPRTPQEPSAPHSDHHEQLQTRLASSTKSPPPHQSGTSAAADEIELRDQASKSAGGGLSSSKQRSVRMPDTDYRTSVLMNDLRSMQNSIGLPQPPRLQRSSSYLAEPPPPPPPPADEGLPRDGALIRRGLGGLSLADQIVASRMSRVEALLSHGSASAGHQANVAPQQASVQQSVAVRANRSELDELMLRNKPQSKSLLNETSPNELDVDQPRRRTQNGSPKSASAQADTRVGSPPSSVANETAGALFEAQRLSATGRAKLRAEKVSELEKFQQRLRTQQLLLEQLKSQAPPAQGESPGGNGNGGGGGNKPKKSYEALSGELANSHVKYDEPPTEATHHELPLASQLLDRAREHSSLAFSARPRRQNELVSATANQTTARPPQLMSELARQLRKWPSVQASSLEGPGPSPNEIPSSGFKTHKLDLPKSISGGGSSSPRAAPPTASSDGAQVDRTNSATTTSRQQQQQQPDTSSTIASSNATATQQQKLQQKSPNTINLDFINSVTALSVDRLNPFAISSVNPAVQRTQQSGGQQAAQASSPSGHERLSPHRLSLPLTGGGQSGASSGTGTGTGTGAGAGTATRAGTNGNANNLLATSAARYFSSPDLLAALEHHERHDTSQQLRALFSDGAHSSWPGLDHVALSHAANGPANHQTGAGPVAVGAPYTMQAPAGEAAGLLTPSSGGSSALAAKFLVGPTASLSEAANSQHKSVLPMPRPSRHPAGVSGARQQSTTRRSVVSVESPAQRDGFDVRDRRVQLDNHRFYEVVASAPSSSNLKHPSETSSSSSFQAFRDAQLSISANTANNRRRRRR